MLLIRWVDTRSSGKLKRKDRYDSKFAKSDQRMKHGKNFKQFVKDIDSAKDRLRKGEVKKI